MKNFTSNNLKVVIKFVKVWYLYFCVFENNSWLGEGARYVIEKRTLRMKIKDGSSSIKSTRQMKAQVDTTQRKKKKKKTKKKKKKKK